MDDPVKPDTTPKRLGAEFDLPPDRAASVPSGSAYQCPVCHGIAYNPVCPYCEDDEAERMAATERAEV